LTTHDDSDTSAVPTPGPGEPVEASGSFQTPAEYYSSPPSPRIPKWVPIGCGVASILILLVLFAGGALLRKGGGGKLVGFVLSTTEKQIDAIAEPDVTPEARNALKSEFAALRGHLDRGEVGLNEVQDLQQSISRAIRDQKLTAAEIEELTEKTREINRKATRGSESTDGVDSI
jgi:hypothetical protein